MNPAPENIDDLIASYLAGEATHAEKKSVDAWIGSSAENQRYFEELRLIFEKAAANAMKPIEHFDTDKAWQKLRTRLSEDGAAKTIKLDSGFSPYQFFLRVAAGVILVLAVGFFAYRVFRTDAVTSVRLLAGDTTAADTLPDGSGVFLNRATKIEYAANRKNNARTAKLEGEAYFHVRHDEEKTFIVEAEETFIRDIGTSFNVKAYPGSPTIEVVVEEGEVMFYTEGNPGVHLKANGKGIYHRDTRTFTVSQPEPNVTAYRTRTFIFTNQALGKVVETLNDVYPARIQIEDHLKSCRLTVSFHDETIDEIANIIAETLGLTVSNTGNMITLTGPACDKLQP
ncbi:MAG: FecR domain-containing protein [Chryseosolibacter sp.]